jgi:hypothetical protein
LDFYLVGGLEHFGFFHILGKIIPIDFHIFQDGSNHQPVMFFSKRQKWGELETTVLRRSYLPTGMIGKICGKLLFFSSQISGLQL